MNGRQTASLSANAADHLRMTKKQLISELDSLEKQVEFYKERERITDRSGTIIHDSESMFHSLFEDSRDAIYITSKDGRFVDINRAGLELFGYTRDEVIGSPASKVYADPNDRKRFMDEIDKRGAVQEYEISLRRKNGTIIDCLLTSTIWYGPDHQIIGYQGIIRDITEHKQAELRLKQSFEKLQRTMEGIIHAISLTLEIRDPYTAGHQRRVADLAKAVALRMQLSEKEIEGIRLAGTIHDIGKIYIPAEILSKPGRISEIEFNIIKLHPEVGYDILKSIEFPWPIAKSVYQHHERWDGSGYPNGMHGEDILLEARILAVADVVEVMASHRPYRPALGIDKALAEITMNSGILYDPTVVKACLDLFAGNEYQLSYSNW